MILFTLVSQVLLLIITIQSQFPWAVLGRFDRFSLDLNELPPSDSEEMIPLVASREGIRSVDSQVPPITQVVPFTPYQQQHYAEGVTASPLNDVHSRIPALSSSNLPLGGAQVRLPERLESSASEGFNQLGEGSRNPPNMENNLQHHQRANPALLTSFLGSGPVIQYRDENVVMETATRKRKKQASDLFNSHVPSVTTLFEKPARNKDQKPFSQSLERFEWFEFDFQAETRYRSSLTVVPFAAFAVNRPRILVESGESKLMPPEEGTSAILEEPTKTLGRPKKPLKIVSQRKSQNSVPALGQEAGSSLKSVEKEKKKKETDVEDSTKQDVQGARSIKIDALKQMRLERIRQSKVEHAVETPWWYQLDQKAMEVLDSTREDLFPVEKYLVFSALSATWEESHIFHLMQTYLEWIGVPSKPFFMSKTLSGRDSRVYTKNWKKYFPSPLFSIGNFDPKTERLLLPPQFDCESLTVHSLYDRWRWMKQVQKAYDIPPSRKVLCEGLMFSGYVLSPYKNDQQSNFDRVRFWEKQWKSLQGPEYQRSRGSAMYNLVFMRNMAEVTEITWDQQKLYRNHINKLYQKPWTPFMQNFWEMLLPGVTDATDNTITESELTWEQHEIIWEKLQNYYNQPKRNQLAQESWDFEETKANELWNLVYGVKNAQKQLQIGMDQLYSAMTLILNVMRPRVLEDDRDRAIQRLSDNIHMYNAIGRYIVDSAFGTHGLIEFFEKPTTSLSKKTLDEIARRTKKRRNRKTDPFKKPKSAKGKRR